MCAGQIRASTWTSYKRRRPDFKSPSGERGNHRAIAQAMRSAHFTRAFLIAAVCWSAPASAVVQVASGGIRVSVEETGRFEVTTHNPAWKFSGSVGAPLAGLATGVGRDRVGA